MIGMFPLTPSLPVDFPNKFGPDTHSSHAERRQVRLQTQALTQRRRVVPLDEVQEQVGDEVEVLHSLGIELG